MFDFAVYDSVAFNFKWNCLIIFEIWKSGLHGFNVVGVVALIDGEFNNLLTVTQVGYHESGAKEFAGVIRIEIHYV
jgi:hypothetical protein